MTNNKPPQDPTASKLRTVPGAITEGVNRAAENTPHAETCSFCGRGPTQIGALVTKQLATGSVKICDLCVNAARSQLQDP